MRTLEWAEPGELDGLAELCEVLDGILHLLQAASDGIGLGNDLEDRIANGILVKQVVDRHDCATLIRYYGGARKSVVEIA